MSIVWSYQTYKSGKIKSHRLGNQKRQLVNSTESLLWDRATLYNWSENTEKRWIEPGEHSDSLTSCCLTTSMFGSGDGQPLAQLLMSNDSFLSILHALLLVRQSERACDVKRTNRNAWKRGRKEPHFDEKFDQAKANKGISNSECNLVKVTHAFSIPGFTEKRRKREEEWKMFAEIANNKRPLPSSKE